MTNKHTNPCSRCGKERVIFKRWKEVVVSIYGNKQEVTYAEAVCPDPECQRIINKELQKQKKKRDDIAWEKQQRVKDKQKQVKRKLP